MTLSSPASPPLPPVPADASSHLEAASDRAATSVRRRSAALEGLERQARAEVRALAAAAAVPAAAGPDDMLITALAWDLGLGGSDIADPT